MLTFLVFLAILSVLVLIHELGHFLVAKKFGIWVEEFGFGLPPRIFGKKIGETIYSLNALPIGGFVRLHGEEGKGEDRKYDLKRAFFARPKWQRMVVLLAGVAMNTFLAVVIFYGFLFLADFKTEIPLLFDHKFSFVNQSIRKEVIISEVIPGSPAQNAGIRRFSQILSVNGQKIEKGEDFVEMIAQYKGKDASLELKDLESGQIYVVKAKPRVSPPENEGPLGVTFNSFDLAILNYETGPQKIFSGLTHPFNLLVYNFKGLGILIEISIREKSTAPVGSAVAGPVGIFPFVDQILKISNLKERILAGLNFVGLISISLALFNVLPIPALDGGRLLFVGIEALVGRRVKPKIEAIIHQIGFALLILLILLVTYNDILRLNLAEKIKNLIP